MFVSKKSPVKWATMYVRLFARNLMTGKMNYFKLYLSISKNCKHSKQ